ncbi:MAG: MBL fold metallo-hydrolase [Bacillota bacterium]|nr:MBL fold metallo-hydrolase [Bacillota bacterium]
MIIKNIPLGIIKTNCYIAVDETTREAVIIDPAEQAEVILNMAKTIGASVKYVILTHAHFDHMGAVEDIMQETGARLVTHAMERGGLENGKINLSTRYGAVPIILKEDIAVNEGDEIVFGNSTLKVIYTPGHTAGGMSLYGGGVLFSGDTLFCGNVGRCDFPGGDEKALISSINEKLYTLPDETVVYCGHGASTTIGEEKAKNVYTG